jgi:putative isomerase
MRLATAPEGRAYVEPPVAHGSLAFAPAIRPVNAFCYDDLGDVRAEFEERGYYARPPARSSGGWAVFRFNAVTPVVRFAAVAGVSGDAALERPRALAVQASDTIEHARRATPSDAGGLAAVRDVVGWNTVWDPVHGRPYTVTTRGWVSTRFGGFIVWQIDTFVHAIIAAEMGDAELARANLRAALALATPDGNLAALDSGVTSWVDRAHPPIGALATWWVHRRAPLPPDVLADAVRTLGRAYRWWFERRDGNGDGLLEYGSSPVGDGHFVHTRLAAMDESAMDNSPVHDEATFREDTHTLDVADVGLNALLVLEGRILARLAAEAGIEDPDVASMADALADRVRDRLWDDTRGIYGNRRWDGRFVASLSPTSFFAMLAGVARHEQARRMVDGHLTRDDRFWGDWPVASTPHDDRAAADNVYWRGRVWPPLNALVYLGLRRYGFDDLAHELAARGAAMFERGWSDRRSYENFDQRTGEGGGTSDADPFYTWGVLLPLLAEIDRGGRTPWDDLLDVERTGAVSP